MKGPVLRGAPVASERAHQRARDALDVLAEVQKRVRDMGLPEYPKPSTSPRPIADIDVGSLNNRELETLFSQYVSYSTYILPKLAEVEAAYKVSTSNLKGIEANIRVRLAKEGVPKADIPTLAKDAPEYITYELEHLKLYATKEILASHLKAYSTQAKTLSRCIELRKLEFEQEHRAHNIGNYRHGDPLRRGGLPVATRNITRRAPRP